MFKTKNILYFLIFTLVVMNKFSCIENIDKYNVSYEYYHTNSPDSLLENFPFLKLLDTLTQYYEMKNIISGDTIAKDYTWDLLTFEKIIYAKRTNDECLLIGNLWGSKRAIIIFGINNSKGFNKIYSYEINFIDTLKLTNIKNFYFFEIESFYQTYCEKHVGYNLFVYQSPKFGDAFTTLKSVNIINDDPLCSDEESYNTIFSLLEENNSIKLLSKKYYYQTTDTLLTFYKFDESSLTFL